MTISSARQSFDVVGIGNAIIDILAAASDQQIAELGLAKGTMTLVDRERSDFLYAKMGAAREVSGGSAANTVAAIASLGGKAAFIGRVHDDAFGKIFAHDLRASGVTFENAPATSGPPTARCLVFVPEDAQRTMQTYLGACVELCPDDVDEALVASGHVVYLEGYLWDKPAAKAACIKAADIAHKVGNKVALTLSDPFCVGRWRSEFLDLIHGRVDILFANEAEITALFETDDFDAAVQAIAPHVEIAALTRGALGSVIVKGERRIDIAASPCPTVLDTTGAGDLFAAGFLRGLTAGLDLEASGRLASASAASILGIFGPRASEPLLPLFEEAARGH
ncbi:Sugar or nucleoside kinase, ribokinase family [Arboricoccus pini]|uniref:Sugar or nucleoside kinase, ribokinase family n=1 Tax=Arboricoccus pini TaxID=1963835 RepID=A0A212Q2T1_9PROT|nr:adenosine kinase [Arboricoccus pini]SNB53468.1 Sugar or nucleoside kinase, ribokinase family [Arboricoccus pini]